MSRRPLLPAPHPEGVALALRLQPGARKDVIEGLATLDDGCRVLKLRVRAPAEKGKANAACPPSALSLANAKRRLVTNLCLGRSRPVNSPGAASTFAALTWPCPGLSS